MQIKLGTTCRCGAVVSRNTGGDLVDDSNSIFCATGPNAGGYHYVNERNLANLRCPSCHVSYRFTVTLPVLVDIEDTDVTVNTYPTCPDWESDPQLRVTCQTCGHSGVTDDFMCKEPSFNDVADIDAFLSA